MNEEVEFTDLPDEDEIQGSQENQSFDAVLHATDWTTETIINQLAKKNIVLNPRFQRRDAWEIQRKSRFIESLILGLPIPQLVLAEMQGRKGKYIVLDGKQRLLALLQFWGLGEGKNNGYSLAGLEVKKYLSRKKLGDLENDINFEDDLNALLNQSIRTIVIRNWQSLDFLHLVFLRLNTGSVKLSPQELRQALFPGPFSDWIDDKASSSHGIKALLNINEPDYRMRDIEILARYFAFRFFTERYSGNMKNFLDLLFREFNDNWNNVMDELEMALADFENAVNILIEIFPDGVAKKPGARQFNRAIFDFLIFYAYRGDVRDAMIINADAFRVAYQNTFHDINFVASIERATADTMNTAYRLSAWGKEVMRITKIKVPIPIVRDLEDGRKVIRFQ